MPLDLAALSRQVRSMSGALTRDADDRRERQAILLGRYLEEARAYATWAEAVDMSRESFAWVVAVQV